MNDRPLIYQLLDNPLSGAEIEERSFSCIDTEAPAHDFSAEEWQVVRRLIHTTADFAMAELIRFSPQAIRSACTALKQGAAIYVDSNMIRSGLSLPRLQQLNRGYSREAILCHVADEDVAEEAKETGLPRSLFAIRKAGKQLDGGIVLIGNAPVALLELNRMAVEENIRPALVIGMPVGFVHVLESKEELMDTGLPYIVLSGRRGGSPLAVAALHALCGIAA
ncbi:precorrin-8X methylmutase [Trichloromonas sp.]|uniref:precorrin-8X methylmutase n=1 Tax=Trichloromonas sp. TaxID=3069249 RepID=UPI001E0D6452|nr:precorrin-8X methylmutase [Desulfuromonadaceae bacterium]MDY0269860.1 precorrin-8X methylmutase [Trichloromonas sp.]